MSSTYINNEFLSPNTEYSSSLFFSGTSTPANDVRLIEIISVDEDSATKPDVVAAECQNIIKELNLVLMLRTNDSDGYDRIYISHPDKDNRSDTIIVESMSKDEYEVVFIKGKINAQKMATRYANSSLNF